MHMQAELPTPFETLAAVCKFIALPKISPDFYAKHRQSSEMAAAFLRVLANNYPDLERAFRAALPVSLTEGGKHIEEALLSMNLPEDKLHWIDSQTTSILKALLAIVRDPELPAWLAESKWAIEGAFE